MPDLDLKPLAELRSDLHEAADSLGLDLHALQRLPSYRQIQTKALDGRLPGAVRRNGRWHYHPSRRAEIAAALGLTSATDTAIAA